MNKNKHILLMCIFTAFFYTGCKPEIPRIKDYKTVHPCALYDRCKILQAYGSKDDCKIELQKCLIYLDYDKCSDDKDCWNRTGIRY